MTDIYLIRHGETEWNRLGKTQGASDIPLNDAGRLQAHATGRALARGAWDAVYTSPSVRASETASIICSHGGCSGGRIIPDERLMERSYGSAEGLTIPERTARFGHKNAVPDAEPWETVKARGIACIEEIAETHPQGHVLAVGHGGLITSVLVVITDGEYTHRSGPLKNAGVSRISYDPDDGWRLVWYNRDASDLVEPMIMR
ncbi:MAG: histidine phosphatase family protein [Spirochaeta sp.]|jgi:uncharacterized phosphatase|nr:histidine phosphatase family protein [Spirochaeta sp.]